MGANVDAAWAAFALALAFVHSAWATNPFALRRKVKGGVLRLAPPLRRLPRSLKALGRAGCVTTLDVSGAQLASLDGAAVKALASSLEHLLVSRCGLEALPAELGALRKLRTLDASHNRIAAVGPWVGGLAPTLESLNLMCNELTSVPDEVGSLAKLVSLGLKSNRLECLPSSVGGLKALVHLFLTDNRLRTLPASISECASLRKVQASSNRIASLPASMANMQSLEFLRLACNRLEAVPEALRAPRLAWVGLAGNPVADRCVRTREVPLLTGRGGDGLDLHSGGGAAAGAGGASGDVRAARLHGEEVVVKWFLSGAGGYVSPDGSPSDEIAVATFVRHPSLTESLAKVLGDKGRLGLVMRRAPGRPLGMPHDFSSVLRCRYAAGFSPSERWAASVFSDVAGAMAYMHSNGVAMSDLFAHNVLCTGEGRATVCDFGGSFFYSPSAALASGVDFERQEVRALGLLLLDAAERGAGSRIGRIAEQCLAEPAALRPVFATAKARLEKLRGRPVLAPAA